MNNAVSVEFQHAGVASIDTRGEFSFNAKQSIHDKIINMASHELRTPIQIINGFVHLAKEGLIDHEEAWEGVISGAVRLRNALMRIHDECRISRNQLTYEAEKFLISQVINDVINNMGTIVNKVLSVQTDLDEDGKMIAERNLLVHMLRNIIIDGMKLN